MFVLLMGFFKCIIDIGSGAMIYVPSFIKTGAGIQKLLGGGDITDSKVIS
jgi:hypothetical protein